MTRLARRDAAVFVTVLVLVVAIAVLAVLDFTDWAIALLAVLVGVVALIAQIQFAARRSTYQRLRRESHSTREATKQTAHLAKAIVERLHRLERSSGGSSSRAMDELRSSLHAVNNDVRITRDSVHADMQTTRDDVNRSRDALRADLAAAAIEREALRAELRGVRVAQQLFTQSLGAIRTQVDSVVAVSGDAAMKADLHELTKLAEIVSKLGDAATRDDLSAFAESSNAVRADVAGEIRDGLANDIRDLRDGVAREVATTIRPTINSLEWEIRRQRPELISDLQAMQQLFDRFAPTASLPAVAGWAMSPGGLLMLTDEIAKRQSDLVVECGSGASTLWMALAMRKQGHGKVVALEHLPEFAEKTRAMLQAHGVTEWAEVRDAPLTTVTTPQGEFQWYDTTGMQWEHEIDILLVDGPPTKTGPHARYPALSALADVLKSSALVVVDDADRQDEQEVIALWQQEWPELVHLYSPGRGIEVFSRSAVG